MAQGWLWGRGNTGGVMDGWAVATDPSGNVFAGGIALGGSPGDASFGNITVPISTPLGGFQCIIAKYDANGNVLWVRGTEDANTYLMNIAADKQGNAFMFGTFYGTSMKIGSYTLSNSTPSLSQYFLAKFDKDGNVVWAKNDGQAQGTYVNVAGISYVMGTGGIATDNAGNIYVTANFSGVSIRIGSSTLTNADISGVSTDVFVAKYDPAGNVLWAKSAGGIKQDEAYGITITTVGDVYIAGDFGSPAISFGSSIITNSSTNQIAFIARFDKSGNPLWASGSDGSGGEFAVGVACDVNNNVYLTGGLKDPAISFAGTTITNPTPGHPVLYLVKFNPSNTVDWSKTIWAVDSGGVWGYSIAMSQCGVIWVSGVMKDSISIDGHILRTPAQSPDPIFIAGYNTDGTYAGSDALQSGGDDQSGIACDMFGNLYLCSDYQTEGPFIAGKDTLPAGEGWREYLYIAKHTSENLNSGNGKHISSSVCVGIGILRVPEGNSHYLWSNGSTEKTYKVSDTGVVWVYGYDSCVSGLRDTFKVVAACDCSKSLFVPNAFTPNADGQDDVFYPRTGPGIDKIKSFRVYNRWGELLFGRENIMANDAANAWDGTYKGEKPLPDVYVWVVEAVCENGDVMNKKGSVTVIR